MFVCSDDASCTSVGAGHILPCCGSEYLTNLVFNNEKIQQQILQSTAAGEVLLVCQVHQTAHFRDSVKDQLNYVKSKSHHKLQFALQKLFSYSCVAGAEKAR